jgi:hypothetical protein
MTRNINSALSSAATLLLLLLLVACGGQAAPTPGPEQTAALTDTPASAQSSTLTPSAPGVNTAPNVGARAEVTRAAILQLHGSVQDDITPSENLTVRWTRVSGPGSVEFADPSTVNTTATFTVPGTYVLRLTVSDGQYTVSDEVTVVVQP